MFSRKWLIPGMQVKRWLGLLLFGVTLIGLGFADLLIFTYQAVDVPAPIQEPVGALTLQFLPQVARGALLGVVGASLAFLGIIGFNRSLVGAARARSSGRLVDLVDQRRRRRAGLKIVTIGGGTGLSTMLRGLKLHSSNITAIVTVADDGGSSGRLRRSLGVHPPGDFRQCIAALAETEPLMERLFQYRFGEGELGGHAFGNLFIVAMTGITGSFESALQASSRVLAVSGRIVPSTLTHVTLFAELEDDRVMAGESQVPQGAAPIRRVFLDPPAPPAYPEAVRAILDADLIVLGPGSLYTSVLPNLLVPDIAAALAATQAPVVYVANVATQPGETEGFDLGAHVRTLMQYLGEGVVDFVLANNDLSHPPPAGTPGELVAPVMDTNGAKSAPRLVLTGLVSPTIRTHHDPALLADAVLGLVKRNGG